MPRDRVPARGDDAARVDRGPEVAVELSSQLACAVSLDLLDRGEHVEESGAFDANLGRQRLPAYHGSSSEPLELRRDEPSAGAAVAACRERALEKSFKPIGTAVAAAVAR